MKTEYEKLRLKLMKRSKLEAAEVTQEKKTLKENSSIRTWSAFSLCYENRIHIKEALREQESVAGIDSESRQENLKEPPQ